ncbi:hypothetical protein KL935_003990 [Ogataea polymorpha]|nr:hypothetical protein KL935_003990 [Ogataea polymorpha]
MRHAVLSSNGTCPPPGNSERPPCRSSVPDRKKEMMHVRVRKFWSVSKSNAGRLPSASGRNKASNWSGRCSGVRSPGKLKQEITRWSFREPLRTADWCSPALQKVPAGINLTWWWHLGKPEFFSLSTSQSQSANKMSYYNDPFYSFFENINQEVAQLNSLFSDPFFRSSVASTAPGNRRLDNKKSGNEGKEVARPSNQTSGPWDLFRPSAFFDDSFAPPVDIHDNDDSYDVTVAIPGAPKDKVTIDYNKKTNELIVKGEIPERETTKTKANNTYTERTVGKFSRVLKLPVKVDGDKIQAKFENGLLNLTVPKSGEEDEGLQRIEISSSESYDKKSA